MAFYDTFSSSFGQAAQNCFAGAESAYASYFEPVPDNPFADLPYTGNGPYNASYQAGIASAPASDTFTSAHEAQPTSVDPIEAAKALDADLEMGGLLIEIDQDTETRLLAIGTPLLCCRLLPPVSAAHTYSSNPFGKALHEATKQKGFLVAPPPPAPDSTSTSPTLVAQTSEPLDAKFELYQKPKKIRFPSASAASLERKMASLLELDRLEAEFAALARDCAPILREARLARAVDAVLAGSVDVAYGHEEFSPAEILKAAEKRAFEVARAMLDAEKPSYMTGVQLGRDEMEAADAMYEMRARVQWVWA